MKKLWSGIKSLVNLNNKSLKNISQVISDDDNIIFKNLYMNVS